MLLCWSATKSRRGQRTRCWVDGDLGSTSETSTELRKYTKQLYSSLEEETGDWLQSSGFIEVASNTDRLEEYRRVAAFNRKCGVDEGNFAGRDREPVSSL